MTLNTMMMAKFFNFARWNRHAGLFDEFKPVFDLNPGVKPRLVETAR